MKMIDFDKAIKGLEDIRKFHNSGKKLFLNDLKSADSIDDLKKIMVNHVKVFFNDMNFMFSLSGKSFELIRYVSKTNKKMSKSTHMEEFGEGKVRKTMRLSLMKLKNLEKRNRRKKKSREKYMVNDEFLDVERLRNALRVKRVNDEFLEYLASSLRWIIHYCRKHDIPLPEEDKIIDLCNKAIEIEKKLP